MGNFVYSAPRRDAQATEVGGVSGPIRPPLERKFPLTAEEWAEEFFSRAPQYRTKALLVEIIRQVQRDTVEKAHSLGALMLESARSKF